MLKFPQFRHHGNRDLSDANLNDTVKFPNLENTLFSATFSVLLFYCISQIFANVVFKKHNLVTVVTKVSLGQISTMPLNCPTPKSPFWCQHNPLIFCILAFCTWSSTLDALVSVANDFDVADIPNPGVWKWPSLGK